MPTETPLILPLTEPLKDMSGSLQGDNTVRPIYASSEMGNVAATTVVVNFSEPVNSPALGYDAGVTIKVGGVGQTISAATRQVAQAVVHYEIPKVTLIQVVTWEYVAASGDIEDQGIPALGLLDVSASATTNNIGSHFKFNIPDNSGHLIHL